MTERSREIGQLDSLVDWLSKSAWTPREAACLLVGVLPPEPDFGFDDRPFGAWLPGQEPWGHARELWQKKIAAEIDQMERKLASIPNVGVMPPADLLAHLVRQNSQLLPPWGSALLNSAAHTKSLPVKVRARLREALGMSQEIDRRANSAYAMKLKNDPDWDLQVREAERRWKEGQTNKQIADALADSGYPTKTESAISGWTRKFGKNISAEAQTAGFRDFKDRMNSKALM